MKSTTFALASLLSTAVFAHGHQHADKHAKRDVVWVTDYDYVTEIVGETTTIWVTSSGGSGGKPTTVTSTMDSASPSASASAAQFFQPSSAASVQSSAAAQAPSSESASSSATSSAAPASSAESSSPTQAAPSTFATSTSAAASSAAPSSTVQSSSATTSSSAAASSTASSSSSSGECTEGSPCAGDITYYDTGLGACGETNANTDHVIALPHGLMGTQSNGNPYCGRTVSITCESTGKTATATVVDKCMGCDGYSIDLSPAVFDELADESVGRTTATWYFTD